MKEIEKLRDEIDEIDSEILVLLGKRYSAVKKIKIVKKKNGINVIDLKREKKIFERLKKFSRKYNLDMDSVEDVFKVIINNSRKMQK